MLQPMVKWTAPVLTMTLMADRQPLADVLLCVLPGYLMRLAMAIRGGREHSRRG